jgi:hypothetical protein
MLSMPKKWVEMPSSVKNAILFLCAGWAAHYIFYFGFIAEGLPERVTYLNLGVGIAICYCVGTIRKWARKLCIFFNMAMVAAYMVYAIVFAYVDQVSHFALTAFVAAAFAFSLYFLLQKETARFFSPPEENKEQESDDSAHKS